MATSTLSEMYSGIYLATGSPSDDLLSRLELANIVFRRLAYRLEAVRDAETSISIVKSAEFTLGSNSNTYDLTSHISDFVIPMWAEYKGQPTLGNPIWFFLPTVHISMLTKYRTLGQYACSFYGSDATQVTVETSLYGNENPPPFNTLRVWYCPDIPFPGNEQATLKLPNNLVSMVQYDSVVSALPLMIVNASKQLKKMPEYEPQIKAWEGLLAEYKQERAEFEVFFEKYRKESRGAHRPSSRPDILANRTPRTNFPFFVRTGS